MRCVGIETSGKTGSVAAFGDGTATERVKLCPWMATLRLSIRYVSGFRWSFFGLADVPIGLSLLAIAGFTLLCLAIIWWIFKTGYKLKT